MADHQEKYKGKEIVIRHRAADTHRSTETLDTQETELLIEGKPVFIVQNSAGQYLAAGFAFDPQSSPLELAKKIIDYQAQGGR